MAPSPGSVLHLNDAVHNLQQFGGTTLREAVSLASLSPAKVLRVDKQKGSLETGKDADINLIDKDCRMQRTIISGETKYLGEA